MYRVICPESDCEPTTWMAPKIDPSLLRHITGEEGADPNPHFDARRGTNRMDQSQRRRARADRILLHWCHGLRLIECSQEGHPEY